MIVIGLFGVRGLKGSTALIVPENFGSFRCEMLICGWPDRLELCDSSSLSHLLEITSSFAAILALIGLRRRSSYDELRRTGALLTLTNLLTITSGYCLYSSLLLLAADF